MSFVAVCSLAFLALASAVVGDRVHCNPAFRAKELVGLSNQRRFTELVGRYSSQALRVDNGVPFYLTNGSPLTSAQRSCFASKGVFLWLAHSADVLTVEHEKTTSRSDEHGWRARFVEDKPPKEMPTAKLDTTLYFNGKPLKMSATYEFNQHCKVVKESYEYDAVSPAFAAILLAVNDCVPPVKGGDAVGGAAPNVEDVMSASPTHTSFDALVRRSGLTMTLQTSDVTVFAPSNDALDHVKGKLEELSEAQVREFVQKHIVVDKKLAKADLAANGNKDYDTVGGSKVHVEVEDDVIFVNNAPIKHGDVFAKNGVVHYVDKVVA